MRTLSSHEECKRVSYTEGGNTSPRLVATLPFIACVLFSLPTVHVRIMVLYDGISCITQ